MRQYSGGIEGRGVDGFVLLGHRSVVDAFHVARS